jgi:hypothetical protein
MFDRNNQEHREYVWERMLRKFEAMLPHEHDPVYRKSCGSSFSNAAPIHRPRKGPHP